MSSRGKWCESRGCLNSVDAGWGVNQCARCRGYHCQEHMYYDGNADHRRYCPDCLEAVTQERIKKVPTKVPTKVQI